MPDTFVDSFADGGVVSCQCGSSSRLMLRSFVGRLNESNHEIYQTVGDASVVLRFVSTRVILLVPGEGVRLRFQRKECIGLLISNTPMMKAKALHAPEFPKAPDWLKDAHSTLLQITDEGFPLAVVRSPGLGSFGANILGLFYHTVLTGKPAPFATKSGRLLTVSQLEDRRGFLINGERGRSVEIEKGVLLQSAIARFDDQGKITSLTAGDTFVPGY